MTERQDRKRGYGRDTRDTGNSSQETARQVRHTKPRRRSKGDSGSYGNRRQGKDRGSIFDTELQMWGQESGRQRNKMKREAGSERRRRQGDWQQNEEDGRGNRENKRRMRRGKGTREGTGRQRERHKETI